MNTTYYINYYQAKAKAEELGLKEAEYGDISDALSYCYWNKSGNREDEAEIYAYYMFENGKPKVWQSQVYADEFARLVSYRTGIPFGDIVKEVE